MDAERPVILNRRHEEGDCRRVPLIGENPGERNARVIVDGNMHELPSETPHAPPAVTMDAMADTADTTQFFDVEVQQGTG